MFPSKPYPQATNHTKPASARSGDSVHRRRGWLRNGNPVGDPSKAPRCGAQTRRHAPCRGPAMANGRCRMHGGASTGPRTQEGLKNSRQARWKHGLSSAPRKQLRRQLAWIREFARVLSQLNETYQLLLQIGETIDLGRSAAVLEWQCRQVLPMYARYLAVLEAARSVGIETGNGRLRSDEQRLFAALWAGAEGTRSHVLSNILAEGLPDAKRTITTVLIRLERRIVRLFGLAQQKIREAFRVCEMDEYDGEAQADRPDHRTRLLAVGTFCRFLGALLEAK